MNSLYVILFLLFLVFNVGCKTDEFKTWVEDAHVQKVGGVSLENLFFDKAECDSIEISLDEILLSNNLVTVSGTMSVASREKCKIDPLTFESALACAIFSSKEIHKPFRLVSEGEFRVITSLPIDQIFESSPLHCCSGIPLKFSYSYRGFPSDSEVRSDMTEMNIIDRFNMENTVRYCMKRIVAVRIVNKDYGYPYEDYTWMNIKGAGTCVIKVVNTPEKN